MADFPPVTLPTPPDPEDGDWGEVINAAFREIEDNVNTVKTTAETALAATAEASDAIVAAHVANPASATHAAVDARVAAGVPAFGTTHSTVAYGDHLHTGVYVTPAQLTTAVNAAVALALADAGGITLPQGLIVAVYYNFATDTWPARPTDIPTSATVWWFGPTSPTIGGVGGMSGRDKFIRQDS